MFGPGFCNIREVWIAGYNGICHLNGCFKPLHQPLFYTSPVTFFTIPVYDGIIQIVDDTVAVLRDQFQFPRTEEFFLDKDTIHIWKIPVKTYPFIKTPRDIVNPAG